MIAKERTDLSRRTGTGAGPGALAAKAMVRTLLAASLLLTGACITPDTVQGALNNMGQRAVNDSADAAYGAGREAVKNPKGPKDQGGACEGARDGSGKAASADKGCGKDEKGSKP